VAGDVETRPHHGAEGAEARGPRVGRIAVAIVARERQRVPRPARAQGDIGAGALDHLRVDGLCHGPAPPGWAWAIGLAGMRNQHPTIAPRRASALRADGWRLRLF